MSFDFLNSVERTAQLRRNERKDFENSFLSGFRVPAEANRLRLQNKQNRLTEDTLDATKDNLLKSAITNSETGVIESDLGFSQAQRNLDYENQFGAKQSQLDSIQLDNDFYDAQEEQRYNTEFREEERELRELKIQDEISKFRSSIKERESQIETRLFDSQFQSLIEGVQEQEFETSGDKFRYMYETAESRGFPRNVKRRIDAEYLEASKFQLETIGSFNDTIVTQTGATDTLEAKRQTSLSQMGFEVDKIDPSFLKLGLAQGVIKTSDLGPMLTTTLENTNEEEFHGVLKGLIQGSKEFGENTLPILELVGASEVINIMKGGTSFAEAVQTVAGEVLENDTPAQEELPVTNDLDQSLLNDPDQTQGAAQAVPVDQASSLADIPEAASSQIGVEEAPPSDQPATIDSIGGLDDIPSIETSLDAEDPEEDDQELDLTEPLTNDKIASFIELKPTLELNYVQRLVEAAELVEAGTPEFFDIIDILEEVEDLESQSNDVETPFDLTAPLTNETMSSFLEMSPEISNDYQQRLIEATSLIGNDRSSETYNKLLQRIIELDELERS